MSQRAPFTLQIINEAGTAVVGASITITNRSTGQIVVPYAEEYSSTYLSNFVTNAHGRATAYLPLGGYVATATSPQLEAPLVEPFDSVPWTPSITLSGGLAGVNQVGLTSLNIAPANEFLPIALGANDPSVTNSRTPGGTAGGDLLGSYPNPTVHTVSGGLTPLTIGATAGGDLEGSFPNPSVVTVSPTVVKATSTYTVKSSDNTVLLDPTSAPFNVILPTAVGFRHEVDLMVVTSGTTHVVTLLTTGGQTISGFPSGIVTLGYANSAPYIGVTLVSDQSNWFVV